MISFDTKLISKIPTKIYCMGKRYEETSKLSLGELIFKIGIDLKKLVENNPELAADFEVAFNPKERKVEVAIISDHEDALMMLGDEIENILWGYNKQVFTRSGALFTTSHYRFNFHIEYCRKTLPFPKA